MVAITDVRAARQYARRLADRWPLDRALLGLGDGRFVGVLVSPAFDGVPWLARVHAAESLWDTDSMGQPLEAHCFTPTEFDRRLTEAPAVRRVADRGLDLLAA
jgi:hypothetical protein